MSSPSPTAADGPGSGAIPPGAVPRPQNAPVVIDIYFDFACPWCYIGRHRLRRALESRPNTPVTLRWQTFQLNPGMPQGGIDRRSYLIAKFGTMERVAHILRLIRMSAESAEIPINLDRIPRTPNTLNAHRLTHLMTRQGHPAQRVIDRLFQAFMVEGLDIGDIDVLSSLAAQIGGDDYRPYLAGSDDVGFVEAQDHAARRIGIHAVPCYVFNGRYALSGAQTPSAFFPFIDHPEIYDGDLSTAGAPSGE